MLLTAFIVAQLVFDVVVLGLVAFTLVRRAAPRRVASGPWEGSDEFLALAEDLVAALESLPEREPRVATVPRPSATPTPTRAPAATSASAIVQLRAGVAPEEVAKRLSLSPAQLRLLTSVAEAEARSGAPASR